MRAGGLDPATPQVGSDITLAANTFNEGRGVRPGNTHLLLDSHALNLSSFNEGRGVRPGNTTGYAVALSGWTVRSMRAGGLDPATRARTLAAVAGGMIPFNEGRGVRPGNTSALGRTGCGRCRVQ